MRVEQTAALWSDSGDVPSYVDVETDCYGKFSIAQVKMSLITQAYFEEGDFSNVSLIKVSLSHMIPCGVFKLKFPQTFLYSGNIRELEFLPQR